jgi:two-component system chemotaxis response regulator CheY
MANSKIPNPNLPFSQLALFDPYWSTGNAWEGGFAAQTPRWNAANGDAALTQLEALIPQFHEAKGWKALRITLQHKDLTEWSTPSKLTLLEGLLTEILPPERQSFAFILPNDCAVVLFYHPHTDGLVGKVGRMCATLVGQERAARTAVHVLDLSKPSNGLDAWPKQARATLAAQAHNQQALETQQRHASIAALLEPEKMSKALQRLAGQKRRGILVIEDDPSTALLLTTLLSDMVKTTHAENAYNAARAYEIHLPALVFLDLGLPDMDGLGLLKLIKAADADACVVILTANATRENLQAATQCGASGFLAKPFTRAKLQEALQKFGLVK